MMSDIELLSVFAWFGDRELCEDIWWHTRENYRRTGEPSKITILVACNDMFWWATADAEEVTAADLPALQQAYDDLEKCGDCNEVYAPQLWVARKRGMRPQTPWWNREKIDGPVRALFLAAGPERDRKDEG